MIFRPVLSALLLVLFAALPGTARDNITLELAESRAARVSETTYKLTFYMRSNAASFQAEAELGFNLHGREGDLLLDFSGGAIDAATCNDRDLDPETLRREANRLWLPAECLKPGRNRVSLRYRSAYAGDGSGLHHFRDTSDNTEYLYTDLQPDLAHRVFPCFDQPDLRARFQLTVFMPRDWEVSANAPETSTRLIGERKKVTFRETPPIATYLFNLTLGGFAVFYQRIDGIPMRVLCRQSQADFMDETLFFNLTERGLQFFKAYFDRPYPFAKYDQIFVPEYNHGAMENPGSVIYNENYILGYQPTEDQLLGLEKVIYHEMAHQWFGNLVTMRWWDDLWLNESFASYMEIIALRETGSPHVWRSAAEDKQAGYRRDRTRATHPIVTSVPDTGTAVSFFDPITYSKGLGVLRQLEFYLGPETFRKGIRHYLDKHAWGNTSLLDFFNALDPYTEKDLTSWRKAWLHTSGTNRIRLKWKAGRGKIRSAELLQEKGNGDGLLRPHRLTISPFYPDENGEAVEGSPIVVFIDGERTRIPRLVGMKKPLFLIPNRFEQTFAGVDLDPISLKWVLTNPTKVADEHVRFRLACLLRNMMFESKITTGEFFDTCMAWLRNGNDVRETRILLEMLTEVADEYSPSSERADRLFDFCRERLERGRISNHFDYLQVMLTVPCTQNRLAWLDQLSRGIDVPKGLDLSYGGKLLILMTLIEAGYPGALERADEAEQNIPDALRETYLPYLKAIRTTPAAKQEAWRRITDSSLSLHQRRMWMMGFAADRDGALLKPYTERYFQNLQAAWTDEPWEYVEAFGETLFPYWDPEGAARGVDSLLARPDLAVPLRNLVLRLKDNLELRRKLSR
ncbi:MAG: aminopeptidase N [Acidobacteriota bacterium]|nr:aminopeptidase N [Acidobacteriota bacterium]